ncbi:cupin domain-containing protein [Roseateles sp. NT4]|uniref:cupin domain-containing protein n=1 Tax=Roseateles sp. NT4 TaxID=3453715 RepID=UPI003EED7C08
MPLKNHLTREEVLVLITGRAIAQVGDEEHELAVGGAMVVPPGMPLSIWNSWAEPFRMVVVLPVGGQAVIPGQPHFCRPGPSEVRVPRFCERMPRQAGRKAQALVISSRAEAPREQR